MVSVAHFDYAMFAFSLPFFNSMENTENIREYFESNDDIIEIKELGNKTMIKEHLSLMRYFENLQSQRDMRRESREVNNSSLQSRKENLIGYLFSLVSKFHKIADAINKIAMTPSQFCKIKYHYDQSTCNVALRTLLNLRSDYPEQEFSGKNTFMYIFVYYTYLDFLPSRIFAEAGNSSSSSGSRIQLDESSKQVQIGMIIDYFVHMIQVSKEISSFPNTYVGLAADLSVFHVFPTVEEYCPRADFFNLL